MAMGGRRGGKAKDKGKAPAVAEIVYEDGKVGGVACCVCGDVWGVLVVVPAVWVWRGAVHGCSYNLHQWLAWMAEFG